MSVIPIYSFTDLGDTLCAIGVKESAAANEAFTKFGDYHRQMEKVGIQMLKKTKRVRMWKRKKFLIAFLALELNNFGVFVYQNKVWATNQDTLKNGHC